MPRTTQPKDRGSALVEFAIILPMVLMLAFGIITAGITYNHKIDLTHAAREGARYGATLPQQQCLGSPNPCGSSNWAQVVQSVVVERSMGAVTAADVCVALVSGDPGTVLATGFSVNSPNANGTCYDDGDGDPGKRVQVSITKTGDKIDGLIFKIPVTLTSQATAKFEQ